MPKMRVFLKTWRNSIELREAYISNIVGISGNKKALIFNLYFSAKSVLIKKPIIRPIVRAIFFASVVSAPGIAFANTAKNTCPSDNPKNFLEIFSEEKQVQGKFVIKDLVFSKLNIETLNDEKTIIRSNDQIPWYQPLGGRIMQNRLSRDKEGLKISSLTNRDEIIAKITKPDTGLYIEYKFIYLDKC